MLTPIYLNPANGHRFQSFDCTNSLTTSSWLWATAPFHPLSFNLSLYLRLEHIYHIPNNPGPQYIYALLKEYFVIPPLNIHCTRSKCWFTPPSDMASSMYPFTKLAVFILDVLTNHLARCPHFLYAPFMQTFPASQLPQRSRTRVLVALVFVSSSSKSSVFPFLLPSYS